MNKSMIRFLLSKLLLIEAALLAIPLTVGLIYREPQSVMMKYSHYHDYSNHPWITGFSL